MSAILSGSWRADPDPLSVSEASLAACLPVLTSTGAGGLAWNRIKRNEILVASDAATELRQHARTLVLETARHEAALRELLRLMHGAGIAPLLFKGWAAAQHYAEPHLRPMGDADLCAPPGQFERLAEVLRGEGFVEISRNPSDQRGRAVLLTAPASWPVKRLLVDLHERLDKFFLDSLGEVFERARPLQLDEASILTPAPEDHLRIAAMHFLRDGGWRPSSLCDVGAMLETLPADFDWDLCLGTHLRRRRWMASCLELARTLLDARLEAMPPADRVRSLPPWLSETVLRAWEKPLSHHCARGSFRRILRRRPLQVPAETLARWPNGIRASVELNAPFTGLPRWPYQFLFFARNAGRFGLRGFRSKARRV